MKFYHGTSMESWKAIKKEGVLWGGCTYHKTGGKGCYRYTYLSPHREVALAYAKPVLLEVEYEPVGVGSKIDNYGFDPPPGETCWQFSVFVPIPLKQVRRIDEEE